MLADLKEAGCPIFGGYTYYKSHSNTTEPKWRKLLESAKQRLLEIDFFGLTEYQEWSRDLFEFTFNLKFSGDFEQKQKTKGSSRYAELKPQQILEIEHIAQYENELYAFAKELFMRRLLFMRQFRKSQLQ